jgi:hypothetical protein
MEKGGIHVMTNKEASEKYQEIKDIKNFQYTEVSIFTTCNNIVGSNQRDDRTEEGEV